MSLIRFGGSPVRVGSDVAVGTGTDAGVNSCVGSGAGAGVGSGVLEESYPVIFRT